MTELELAIGHLKETISVGNVLLVKLEAEQKDAKKPKVPIFPRRFIAISDSIIEDSFTIGLQTDKFGRLQHWEEIPNDFRGRGLFSGRDIQQIITGLQTLLGESNG